MTNQIRVRIAPSPTGPLHIGTARTALFNWLFALKNRGEFILRIEDTDLERSNPKFEEDIKDSLEWLGLEWDEFYKQSERIQIYKMYLEKLLDEEKAFWCYHTKEELKKENEEQIKHKEAPRHVCEYKDRNKRLEVRSKERIIRLAVNENSTRVIHFNDLIRGTIEWEERLIGDLSLAKNLETPLYNFAAVVDDYKTKISHVIRGEDHISNTPKQILIQEALGFNSFQYAHLPLILGPDRTKLSKRHGAESVQEYKKDYLPEAVVNFMGFLGYTYSKEIIKKEEMIEEFNLAKIHKSAAIFNIEKLNWINSEYERGLGNKRPKKFWEFAELAGYKNHYDIVGIEGTAIIAGRLEKMSDIPNYSYFWEEPQYDRGVLRWKQMTDEEIKKSLALTREALEPVDWEIFDKDYIRKKLDDLAKENLGGDRGAVYWPLRVALTGKEASPDPVDILKILDKETALKRLEKAISLL